MKLHLIWSDKWACYNLMDELDEPILRHLTYGRGVSKSDLSSFNLLASLHNIEVVLHEN